MSDYLKAKELGLTNIYRWEEGVDHHLLSKQLMEFLIEHDFYDYDNHFC